MTRFALKAFSFEARVRVQVSNNVLAHITLNNASYTLRNVVHNFDDSVPSLKFE